MMPDEPTVRLALCGAAKQGQEHLAAVAGCVHARIVAACDPSEAARDVVAAQAPAVRLYPTLGELLAEQQVDGLVLALPHDVYASLWPEVLAARLPVLKEKPLGRNLIEAAGFVASAQRAGVPLVTAVQRRHHPTYVALQELLRGAQVEELSATLHLGFDPARRPAQWRGDPARAGGGALLDSGYHMVDLALFLLGRLDLVHASLWNGDAPATAESLESEATLLGRAGRAWVRIESLVGGAPDPTRPGRYLKHERVVALLGDGRRVEADRAELVVDGVVTKVVDRSWAASGAAQLDAFARRILEDRFDDADVWSQVPAMRVIERAYAIARLAGPVATTFPEVGP